MTKARSPWVHASQSFSSREDIQKKGEGGKGEVEKREGKEGKIGKEGKRREKKGKKGGKKEGRIGRGRGKEKGKEGKERKVFLNFVEKKRRKGVKRGNFEYCDKPIEGQRKNGKWKKDKVPKG